MNEFEKICNEQGIDFKDDRFNMAHLDYGNLLAFYSRVQELTLKEVFEDFEKEI